MVSVQVVALCGLCGFSVRLFWGESAQEHQEAAQGVLNSGDSTVRVLCGFSW